MIEKRGKFIVIEGADGLGKSTLIEGLKEKDCLKDVVFLCDPFDGGVSGQIRNILKGYTDRMQSETNLLLQLAARIELNRLIEKNLSEGKNVICDRYELSTRVYQCSDSKILRMYYSILDYNEDKLIIEPDTYLILYGDKPFKVEADDTIEIKYPFDLIKERYRNIPKTEYSDKKKFHYLPVDNKNKKQVLDDAYEFIKEKLYLIDYKVITTMINHYLNNIEEEISHCNYINFNFDMQIKDDLLAIEHFLVDNKIFNRNKTSFICFDLEVPHIQDEDITLEFTFTKEGTINISEVRLIEDLNICSRNFIKQYSI